MPLQRSNDRLLIYHEGRKRRLFVGELRYHQSLEQYDLVYDHDYAYSPKAISLGPELSLFQKRHLSEKGKLFPSLMDRLPSRDNPAYNDYCLSEGISASEENLIVLLGTIGRRGPSSFVFEPVYETQDIDKNQVAMFRKLLGMTQHDFAQAFDFRQITINRIECGQSKDQSTLARIKIYMEFPEVALWQIKQTGGRVHSLVRQKALAYLDSAEKTNHSMAALLHNPSQNP